MKKITSYFFLIGIIGVLSAGFLNDWLVRKRGLKFGRRFFGMVPLALLATSFLIEALTPNNRIVVICLYLGQLCYSFNPLVSFSTCVDIGGNCVGTVAGIMNFFGQVGAFFLAIAFGKIVDLTHSFNSPLFVVSGVLFIGSLLWLFVNPTRQLTTTNVTAGVGNDESEVPVNYNY